VVASVDSGRENANSQEAAAMPGVAQSGYWKFDEAGGRKALIPGANHATLAATASRSAGYAGQSLLFECTTTPMPNLRPAKVSSLNNLRSAW